MANMQKVTVQLHGPGTEIGHIAVSKEAYEFWEDQDEDMLIDYLNSNDDDDNEYDVPVPKEADFLTDAEGKDKEPWFEANTLLYQRWGVLLDGSRIEVEVDGKTIFNEDDDAPYAQDVIIGSEDEDDKDEVDIRYKTKWDDDDDALHEKFLEAKYFITYESVEKGEFMRCEFEIEEDFDKSKLMFTIVEDQRIGSEFIDSATYNGEDIDDEGGDTTGKGVYAFVWEYE